MTAGEAHDGLTGLVVENTKVFEEGIAHQFDAMWISSLCDSTAKGKPDIELVDMTSRFRTIEEITILIMHLTWRMHVKHRSIVSIWKIL